MILEEQEKNLKITKNFVSEDEKIPAKKLIQIVNKLFSSQYHLPYDYFLKGLVEGLNLCSAAVYYNQLDYRWQLVANLVARYPHHEKTPPLPDVIEYQDIWPGLETKFAEGERVMFTEEEIEALGLLDCKDHKIFGFPLFDEKWWTGLLIVDFGKRSPSDEELGLIDELASALSLAIKRQKRESEYLDITRVFQELLNNIPYIVILTDMQGRWLLANTKTNEIFGFKRKIYQGQTFEQIAQIKPQLQGLLERLKRLLAQVPGQDTPVKEVFRIKTKDRIQWWEFLLIPFKCDSEKRILILGRDISSFRIAQERLLTILENLPAMVYVVDPKTKTILYHNTLFKEYFGQDYVNKGPCYELLYGKKQVCEFCHIEKAKEGLREQKEIYDEKHGRWLKLNEVYIHWLDRELVRLGMLEDISEIKQQEEGIIKAQKIEVLGKMTGTVAHEFNNILAVITGYLDLIRLHAGDDPKLTRYIDKILAAVENGSNLIKQFLILSRGKVDNKEETCDLNFFLKEQKELFHKILGENIELELELCQEPLPVGLSFEEMQHILTNLLLNARDAMPQGGKLFIVTRLIETLKGPAALLRIRDTGCGIDKKDLARIFEPFYTTKPSGEGTGLGLNVILSLVRRCGGEIKVDSEPGQGTTFEIILPLKMYLDIKKTGEKDFPHSEGKQDLAVSKKSILIVEDEPHIREMLAEMLEAQGFEVVAAENGEDALNKLKEINYKINLIVTDVVMPKMDGVRLYREVQKVIPEVPVIFISGYAEHILERYGFDEKAFRIIKKPFTFRQLLEEVEKVFSGISF